MRREFQEVFPRPCGFILCNPVLRFGTGGIASIMQGGVTDVASNYTIVSMLVEKSWILNPQPQPQPNPRPLLNSLLQWYAFTIYIYICVCVGSLFLVQVGYIYHMCCCGASYSLWCYHDVITEQPYMRSHMSLSFIHAVRPRKGGSLKVTFLMNGSGSQSR